jgi:hypothetical protein
MSLYRRGKVWHYEFSIDGSRVRGTTKTTSKEIAEKAERERRRELERAINGIVKRERPPLFSIAVKQ